MLGVALGCVCHFCCHLLLPRAPARGFVVPGEWSTHENSLGKFTWCKNECMNSLGTSSTLCALSNILLCRYLGDSCLFLGADQENFGISDIPSTLKPQVLHWLVWKEEVGMRKSHTGKGTVISKPLQGVVNFCCLPGPRHVPGKLCSLAGFWGSGLGEDRWIPVGENPELEVPERLFPLAQGCAGAAQHHLNTEFYLFTSCPSQPEKALITAHLLPADVCKNYVI